jgi:hypothetical protein
MHYLATLFESVMLPRPEQDLQRRQLQQ